jgi:hypothetical protein
MLAAYTAYLFQDFVEVKTWLSEVTTLPTRIAPNRYLLVRMLVVAEEPNQPGDHPAPVGAIHRVYRDVCVREQAQI